MSGKGRPGIIHGYKSLFLLDDDGQVQPTHSISAGLDYPGIGPQLAWLGQEGRVAFTRVMDNDALQAVTFYAKHEGLVFALEPAHAGAAALDVARASSPDKAVIVNMSGRGEKDLFILAKSLDRDRWQEYLKREAEYEGT